MKTVLQLAWSPVAGAAYELHSAINDFPDLGWKSDLLQGRYDYNDGRKFGEGETIEEAKKNGTFNDMVKGADAFILHNNGPMSPPQCREGEGFIPSDGRPILWIHHSPYWWFTPTSWGLIKKFRLATWAGLHSIEFRQAVNLPFNALPQVLNWPKWCPEMPAKNWNEKPRVTFSPSTKGFPDSRHTKGYTLIHEVCEKLQDEGLIEYEEILGIPHRFCIARKALAHIGIDEVVTGGYHKSMLEGMVCGQAVVTGMADAVREEVFREIGEVVPFSGMRTTASRFAEDIRSLVAELTPGIGQDARSWVEKYWHPHDLIERHYLPLLAPY